MEIEFSDAVKHVRFCTIERNTMFRYEGNLYMKRTSSLSVGSCNSLFVGDSDSNCDFGTEDMVVPVLKIKVTV